MPLIGPSSYVPTVDEFHAHWALVNTELAAAGPMTLTVGPDNAPETVPIATLTALRASLETALNKVQTALNTSEIRRGTVESQKRPLLDTAQALGRYLRAKMPAGSPYLNALAAMPEMSASQENFLRPLRDSRDLWEQFESDTDTLDLPDGTTRPEFSAATDELGISYQNAHTADLQLKLEREKRNALQARAEAILGRYRATVEAYFPPESPFVATIPRLRPLPGHTPDPVAATAVWDAAEEKVRIEWSASDDAELESYQIRMSPAAVYDGDAEAIVDTIAAGAPRVLLTLEGVANPGDTASYKVFVILSTGNERGSSPVAVVRPA